MLLNDFLDFAYTPVAWRHGLDRKLLCGDRTDKWATKAFNLQVSKFADKVQCDDNAYGHDRVWLEQAHTSNRYETYTDPKPASQRY